MAVFSVAHAQTPPVASGAPVSVPALDVISIKPNKNGGGMMGLTYRTDGLRITNGSVHTMLMMAYGMNEDQLIGEPAWVKTERFDIEAKATEHESGDTSAINPDRRPLMLQQVLVERFLLAAHRETRELPVYILSIGRGGARLQQSEPSAVPKKPGIMAGEDRIDAHDTPISLLITILSNQLGRRIIDKTGLAGNYEIRMNWTPDQFTARPGPVPEGATTPAPDAGSGPSIFTAIEEQLGLRLNSTKGPVDVLVIDHIGKPSEN